MDEDSQWTGLTELESHTPGLLDGGFAWRQFLNQRIQFVARVVRRSTYEELGGFRPSLPHCLDWDMWKRIAFRSPLHYDPEPLACFRIHQAADSSRLIASGANVRDERRSIAYSCAELRPNWRRWRGGPQARWPDCARRAARGSWGREACVMLHGPACRSRALRLSARGHCPQRLRPARHGGALTRRTGKETA